jgi:two-component system phosphate regulon sensor histidine kinase PhoR
MSRRLLVLLIILMSLSLIGIIFVQGYWIKTAVEDKEEQFFEYHIFGVAYCYQ